MESTPESKMMVDTDRVIDQIPSTYRFEVQEILDQKPTKFHSREA